MSLQFSCSDEGLSSPCGTSATVVDLEDGCGFGFRLGDGRRLQPICESCVYIPADYRHEGLKVLIGFQERSGLATSCNLSTPVRMLCLAKADTIQL